MAPHAGSTASASSGADTSTAKAHQPPPRRYPAARSKHRIPCVQFLDRRSRGTSASKGKGASSSPRKPKRILVYFITGNPGLAGYYTPFLETLGGLLDGSFCQQSQTGSAGVGKVGEGELEEAAQVEFEFDLYAQNLLGFDDADHEVPFGISVPGDEDADGQQQESLPFSLEDQICVVWDSLKEIVRFGLGDDDTGSGPWKVAAEGDGSGNHQDSSNTNETTPTNSTSNGEQNQQQERYYDQVILMGHSVGAYIGMEIFHRHHQLVLSSAADSDSRQVPFNLLAGVMLFPTVWDIAQSPNGLKFDRFIRNNGFMRQNAHKMAKYIVDWFPSWVLKSVIRNVMGFSDNGAEVTTNFLTSRDGIFQALYLARDEMGTITEEKWEREMWEAQHDAELIGQQNSMAKGDRFFFLFGRKDHWVADKTRDAFIERRKEHGDNARVRVLVDETGCEEGNGSGKPGIPHAFCIHHSEVVAERVKTWIDEIVGFI